MFSLRLSSFFFQTFARAATLGTSGMCYYNVCVCFWTWPFRTEGHADKTNGLYTMSIGACFASTITYLRARDRSLEEAVPACVVWDGREHGLLACHLADIQHSCGSRMDSTFTRWHGLQDACSSSTSVRLMMPSSTVDMRVQ